MFVIEYSSWEHQIYENFTKNIYLIFTWHTSFTEITQYVDIEIKLSYFVLYRDRALFRLHPKSIFSHCCSKSETVMILEMIDTGQIE